MCKTTLATALIIAALGSAMTAINAAGPLGTSGLSRYDRGETHRSVPAMYSRPPWIKRHTRSSDVH
jgi:hypothetical protein